MKDCPQLALENQVCFPIYTVSRLITQKYQPLLSQLDLTYPQYLVLLALWEEDNITVSELSNKLYLKTNTITPLVKRMVAKQLITKERNISDERVVKLSLSKKGKDLRDKAKHIPLTLFESIDLTSEELATIHRLMWKLIEANDQ